MKKNKVMRFASVVLVLTLLSTSAISGTFAKYTTNGSASDTARVANFGVVITASGTLFSDAYVAKAASSDQDMPVTWAAQNDASNITVMTETKQDLSKGGTNIIAPGTKSAQNGLTLSVTGKPEVAVAVKANIIAEEVYLASGYTYAVMTKLENVTAENYSKYYDDDSTKNQLYYFETDEYVAASSSVQFDANKEYYWKTDEVKVDTDYFPVEYTLTGDTQYTATTTEADAIAIAELLDEKVGATKDNSVSKKYKAVYTESTPKQYAANTDLAATVKLGNMNMSWQWKYENGMDDVQKKVYNAQDTILGNMIAEKNRTGTVTPEWNVVAKQTTGNGNYVKVKYNNSTDDYTVTCDSTVVANLYTQFNIKLDVTQID